VVVTVVITEEAIMVAIMAAVMVTVATDTATLGTAIMDMVTVVITATMAVGIRVTGIRAMVAGGMAAGTLTALVLVGASPPLAGFGSATDNEKEGVDFDAPFHFRVDAHTIHPSSRLIDRGLISLSD
jgi:hypothetical protein